MDYYFNCAPESILVKALVASGTGDCIIPRGPRFHLIVTAQDKYLLVTFALLCMYTSTVPRYLLARSVFKGEWLGLHVLYIGRQSHFSLSSHRLANLIILILAFSISFFFLLENKKKYPLHPTSASLTPFTSPPPPEKVFENTSCGFAVCFQKKPIHYPAIFSSSVTENGIAIGSAVVQISNT